MQQYIKPKQKLNWGEIICVFRKVPAHSNYKFREMIKNFKETRKELPNFYSHIPFQDPITGQEIQVYTGIKYQCVEYARRFMVINQQAAFCDIDYAYLIFDLKTVKDLTKENTEIPFLSFKNGENVPPQPGDLIIHQKSQNQPYGHVSVVVRINFQDKYVDVIEQNYLHDCQKHKDYTRRLRLSIDEAQNYYLYNQSVGKMYPKVKENSDSEDSDEEGVIGWKRVEKQLKYFGEA